MEVTVPDTLVLKIVEYDIELNRPDTTLYVLYDKMEHKYLIRGKRFENKRISSCSYSFQCDSVEDLATFIQFLIEKENKISYILYNYDNLPGTANKIDYDYLFRYDDKIYEISGYDNKSLKKKELIRNLRMLRNIYNYY